MRAFVFLSALISNLRALRRAFLSGVETELLLSSEEEGLDGKREEALAPFLAFEAAEGGDGGGVVVLSLSAAGAEGVEGEGVALPLKFSAVAGITLAGVDKVLAWSCLATGLTLGELLAVPTDGELTAEEEENLLGERLRVRTSLKVTPGETLGDSTLNLGSGVPASLGFAIESRVAPLSICIRLSRVPC